ncbi:conserved hypothetical protein [Candidatus Desulfarcum epimagneticum]|uniref:YgiT-type zinc finger domain-containing protein n=1 Tax=uncultured Desulfobacteraceae bacterium TaxID=218296 RepID=A0A484HBT3_9BACT|nr:conserved hypothetical protein [uncultured Desulfobacteraceae bacterium]
MKCAFCGGELKKDFVTFSYEDAESYVLVEHVPAEVCPKCGEKLYSPDVTDALLQFAERQGEPVRFIQVPVYDFSEAMGV